MGFKKDIDQLKKTGKMIGEKSPLVAETSKSVFVIIKWIIIVSAVVIVGIMVYAFAFVYPAERRAEEERIEILKKSELCQKECGCETLADCSFGGEQKRNCYEKCAKREGLR